jgi:hypothetical protein
MRRLALLVLLVGCEKRDEAPIVREPLIVLPKPAIARAGQGLHGMMRVHTGDFMPRHENADGEYGPPGGTVTNGVGRPIHVFRGRHEVIEQLDPADPTYLGKSVVGADGRWAFAVDKPGIYTVITETADGHPYSECHDTNATDATTETGWKYYCPIQVPANTWVERWLEDGSRATH